MEWVFLDFQVILVQMEWIKDSMDAIIAMVVGFVLGFLLMFFTEFKDDEDYKMKQIKKIH